MALTDENGGTNTTMLVQPSGFGGNGDGFGSCWWIILLLLCLGNGMWGGFGGGMWGGMGMEGFGLYPWLNNSQNINGGFRDQMIGTQLSGIGDKLTSGFGDVQTSLCGGFAGVTAAVNGAQNALAQQLSANQIADMERSFAAQTASTAGFTGVNAGMADLKYTVATENCADRTAAMQNTRDIIDAQTRGTQAILDKLCALELDGVKGQLAAAQRENVGLQNQLNMAAMRESQTAQNAFIAQGFANEVDQLYNRLSNCPVPSTPVYGRTPIFTCNGNGCGGYNVAA